MFVKNMTSTDFLLLKFYRNYKVSYASWKVTEFKFSHGKT